MKKDRYKGRKGLLSNFAGNVSRRQLNSKEIERVSSFGIRHPGGIAELCGVTIALADHEYGGLGFRNITGGIEYYCPALSKSPITLESYGISFIPYGNEPLHTCYVFPDFLDYLAYLGYDDGIVFKLARNVDVIVANAPANFLPMIVKTDEYDTICLFMSNDDYGKTVVKTMCRRNPGHVIDMSPFYKGYLHFRDLMRSVRRISSDLKREEQSTIVPSVRDVVINQARYPFGMLNKNS